MSGFLHLEDGRRVPVVDGLVIGRAADCGVALHDEKSSRQHARIVVQVGVVEIEDLGSRNGTLLNGTRIQRRMLRDGDEVTIGRSKLTYHATANREASTTGPAADPAPGDDLFGDAPAEVATPTRPVAPPVAPVETSRPAPPREPAPAAAVDVLEFVDDEVIEVRQPAARAPSPAADADSTVRAAAPSAGPNRVGGVLQFHARPDKRGVLAGDIGQLGGPVKFAIVVLGLAVALGLGWLVMTFVSS